MGYLRNFNLEKYGCDVYVETGTGTGGSLTKATPHFKRYYSVDMDLKMIQAVKDKFENVIFWHEVSTVALEHWLKNDLLANESVLFYLDAHFPDADYNGAPFDVNAPHAVPLKEELELIKTYRPFGKDIIICDDARIYTLGPFEHGNVEWLQVPGGYKFIYDIFPESNIKIIYEEEGYIIIDNR